MLEEERPRLQLKPRTLPLPEIEIKPDDDVKDREPLTADEEPAQPRQRPVPVPAASIFGSAKPVDTAAKDRLIEERMERDRQEKLKAEEEKRAESVPEAKEEDEKPAADDENGATTTAENEEETIAAPAPAPAVQSEPVDWRKRNDDDTVESSRTQSPPRRRISPNRGPRRNGK